MPSPHFDTKHRLLSAAEHLFAQHGFAGTSLRQVTREADVNLAAVNYHFGSKENLIHEMFRRRLDELSERRLEALAAVPEVPPGERLEGVLAAFVEPALGLSGDAQSGASFVRVLARAYAEKNDTLRRFLSENYGHVLREFSRALAACLPGIDKQRLYWRLDFLAGALTYAMADFGMIRKPDGVSDAAHRARAARELVAFAAAGLRAP